MGSTSLSTSNRGTARPAPSNPQVAPAVGSNQAFGFAKGVGQGVYEGGKGLVEGVVGVAKGFWGLATDSAAREQTWSGVKQLASSANDYAGAVRRDPSRLVRDARNGITSARDSFVAAHAEAQQQGRVGEFWGKLVGRGGFEIGTFVVPVTKLGKLGKVGKLGSKAECPLAAAARIHPSKLDPRIPLHFPEFSVNPRTGQAIRNFNPATGKLYWPEHFGFDGTPTYRHTKRGEIFERWGGENGNFLTRPGTSFQSLSMPYDQSKMPLTRWEVLKPFPIHEGSAAPAFGSGGGGHQALTEHKIEWLRRNEYIRRNDR